MNASDQAESRLLEIVQAIRSLTPDQRRRLQRRLRISGLWDPEEYVTDRERLRVAPALGIAGVSVTVASADPIASLAAAEQGIESAAPDVEAVASEFVEYRSSVSGRVVVADAGDEASMAQQQAMAPLPGQAPEEPIVIIFDGGSRGDPPQGHGSYAIRWPGMPQQVVRLRFGESVTDSEAEYDTLIAALEATLQRLQDNKAAPSTAHLDIRGDTPLVISQVTGQAACTEPPLQLRCDRVRFLLRRFGDWSLARYHPVKSSDNTAH